VNSLPKTITRQRRGCDLNPGPSAPESSTLTTRLPSQPVACVYAEVMDFSCLATWRDYRRNFVVGRVTSQSSSDDKNSIYRCIVSHDQLLRLAHLISSFILYNSCQTHKVHTHIHVDTTKCYGDDYVFKSMSVCLISSFILYNICQTQLCTKFIHLFKYFAS